MLAKSAFSYVCNRCGVCGRDKVITLSPYDVIRIARAAAISTGAVVARYTMRRGSILRFLPDGRCAALDGLRCTIHPGRPLACRLYPLGLERSPGANGAAYIERFVRLEPAAGSLGIYGSCGTVAQFLDSQGAGAYLDAVARYHAMVGKFTSRVAATVDFERVEPREFWRRARARRWPKATTTPTRSSTRCSIPTVSDVAARAPRKPPSRTSWRLTKWRRGSATARFSRRLR